MRGYRYIAKSVHSHTLWHGLEVHITHHIRVRAYVDFTLIGEHGRTGEVRQSLGAMQRHVATERESAEEEDNGGQ